MYFNYLYLEKNDFVKKYYFNLGKFEATFFGMGSRMC